MTTATVPPLPSPALDEGWLRRAEALLAERRVLGLVGDAGAGTSGAAAALARRWPGPVVWARLLGCQDQHDVLRVIGAALDLPVRGDPAAVREQLAATPERLVVLDEADAQGLPAALEALSALAGQAVLLLTGRGPAAAIEVLRLPGGGQAPALPADLPELALAAAWLPAGLPGAHPPEGWPPEATRPQAGGFCLTRAAAEALLRQGADPRQAARVALPYLRPLLNLAQPGPLDRTPDEPEVLALRLVATWHPDPGPAAQAAAALVRVLAAAGQLGLGLDVAAAARGRGPPPLELALLDQAEADALLDYGLERESAALYARARAQLEALGERRRVCTLLRARAAALLARGELAEAEALASEAGALAQALGWRGAEGSAQRLLADISLARGEWQRAAGLYDLAEPACHGVPTEGHSLGLGRAGLAIARAELGLALTLLDAQGGAVGLRGAALARRRGDLLLRRGAHLEAAAAYSQAADRLLRLGQRSAAAAAARAEGDARAAAGQLGAAVRCWRRALGLAARAGNLLLARQVLEHWLLLERALGGPQVEPLLGLLQELDLDLQSAAGERTATAP